MIFLYRRLIFTTSVILLRKNVLAILLIQFCMIQFQLSVLHIVRPLETKGALWKQTFDECTYLLLIYILMCFTEFVSDLEMRNKLGIAYISIMFTNIAFHFTFMIISLILTLKLKIKRCKARRKIYRCCCFWKKKMRSQALY